LHGSLHTDGSNDIFGVVAYPRYQALPFFTSRFNAENEMAVFSALVKVENTIA